MRSLILMISLTILAEGCTIDDGRGWATLTAKVKAHLEGEASWTTAEGVPLTLTSLKLETTGLRLLSATAATAPGEFDPANPPPGYSLCHGGHCHTAEGALESYEDIAAKMASGAVATRDIAATVGLKGALDALTAKEIAAPPREMDRMNIVAVAPEISQARIEGTVHLEEGEMPFEIQLISPTPLAPEAAFALALGPDGPESASLAVEVSIAQGLLDGIAFRNLEVVDGHIIIDQDHNAPALELIAARMALVKVMVNGTEDSDDPPEEGEEGDELDHLSEHACVHFQTGPFVNVNASATAEGATVVEAGHGDLVVSLAEGEAGFQGYLTFAMAAPGHLRVLINRDIPLAMLDGEGNALAPGEEREDPEGCFAIERILVFPLEAETYLIELGPGDDRVVEMVISPEEHDHEHEE